VLGLGLGLRLRLTSLRLGRSLVSDHIFRKDVTSVKHHKFSKANYSLAKLCDQTVMVKAWLNQFLCDWVDYTHELLAV
jgi:uncharacterized protein YqiB (DUF1249 family)